MILWSYSDPMMDYTTYFATKAEAMEEFAGAGRVGSVHRYKLRDDLTPRQLAAQLLNHEGWAEEQDTVIERDEEYEPEEEW